MWWSDVKYSLRAVRGAPWFTLVVVFILSLGIGANGAMFSIVHGVLVDPLDFPEPERLVQVVGSHRGEPKRVHSYPNIVDLAEMSRTVRHVSPVAFWGATLLIDEPVYVRGVSVGSRYFDALGIRPQAGRFFDAAHDVEGHPDVVVISDDFWRNELNSQPDVVGSVLKLGDLSYEVLGITPAGFSDPFIESSAIWRATPAHWFGADRTGNWLQVIGRLEGGASVDDAVAETGLIMEQLKEAYPEDNGDNAMHVVPLVDRMVGSSRTSLILLFAAVSALLLLATANIANLVLSRASSRRQETAMRRALGASTGAILRQQLTENGLVSLVAAGVSWGVAMLLLGWIMDWGGSEIPRSANVALNESTGWFIVTLSILSAALLTLFSFLGRSRSNIAETLKTQARTSTDRDGVLLRRALVVSEVAIAFVLLTTAALFVRSLANIYATDPGLVVDQSLTFSLTVLEERHPPGEPIIRFRQELAASLLAIPGVSDVGFTNALPLSGMNQGWGVTRSDRPRPPSSEVPIVQARTVSPGYVRAAGISVIQGRDFIDADIRGGPPVALANESFARRLFPGEDPLGKRVTLHDTEWELVGVFRDVREETIDQAPEPAIYTLDSRETTPDWMRRYLAVVVRSNRDPDELSREVRQAVWSVDPTVPLVGMASFEDVVLESVAAPRLRALVLSILAALGLVLAAAGTAAVIAYSVSERVGEIAIRMAMGAASGQVVRMFLTEAMRSLILGLVLGVVVSWSTSRFLRTLVYELEPTDWVTYLAVGSFLLFVGAAASAIPALRSASVDPMLAMRE